MTLPASGTITLAQIQTEFGGSNPIGLNEYYKGGSYVTSNDYAPNVPSSGAISLSNFYNAKKNTLNTQTFTSSTTFTLPSTSNGILNVYVIGGGGGGGMHSDYWGGYGADGAAAGIASQTISGLTPGASYTIEVGGGGGGGHYGYGYKDNPFADGYGGAGGGQSSAFGVISGGGGGGGGGTPYQNGGNGGGSYGGAGGGSTAPGSAGSGTGNNLSWDGGGYGAAGIGGHYSHDNGGGSIGSLNPPAYANGGAGYVYITGYW